MGFNTYGSHTQQIGGNSKVVWRKVNAKLQSGGTIALTGYSDGDIIPAGTAVALSAVGGAATVCKTKEAVAAAKTAGATMFGLTENDIVKVQGDTVGTCAVVLDGEIYVNRLGDDDAVKAAVAVKELVPGIKFIVEDALPAETAEANSRN